MTVHASVMFTDSRERCDAGRGTEPIYSTTPGIHHAEVAA